MLLPPAVPKGGTAACRAVGQHQEPMQGRLSSQVVLPRSVVWSSQAVPPHDPQPTG